MKKFLIGIGVILVILYIYLFYITSQTEKLTYQQQITNFVQDGTEAINSKNLRKTMSCVEPGYTDSSGNSYESLSLLLLNAFRDPTKFNVTPTIKTITIVDYDSATTDLAISVYPNNQSFTVPRQLTLNLKREKVYKYLFIPAHVWKVAGSDASINYNPSSGGSLF